MADHTHHPNPMHHVQDEKGTWALFHDVLFKEPVGSRSGVGLPTPSRIDVPGFGKQTIGLSKFMLLELLAAALIILIFVLARSQIGPGRASLENAFWNAFEVLLTFVRDEIARPTLGDREADRFVPFLWTMFLFILFCNLLGMFPFMGSPTASIWMTGALATIAFFNSMHGGPDGEDGAKGIPQIAVAAHRNRAESLGRRTRAWP